MHIDPLLALCAAHSLVFALFHFGFWKLFDWPRSLQPAGAVNSAVTQILNLRLTYVFLGVAGLCLLYPVELRSTPLGRAVLIGMSGFWLGRTIEQFVFVRMNRPFVHALTALFILGTVLFALPLFT
jgi:hypothetical protein